MAEVDHWYNWFHKQGLHDIARDDLNKVKLYNVSLSTESYILPRIEIQFTGIQFRYNSNSGEFLFAQKIHRALLIYRSVAQHW